MPRPDFWFNVLPAIVIIPLCLIFFLACARFVPAAFRRRDRGAIAGLVCGYAVMGGYLLVAVDTICRAQLL